MHPIEELMEGSAGAGVVVSEEAPGEVGEALLDDGVGRIDAQSDPLNHAECPQDEGKVGGDLEGEAHRQLI